MLIPAFVIAIFAIDSLRRKKERRKKGFGCAATAVPERKRVLRYFLLPSEEFTSGHHKANRDSAMIKDCP